MKKLAKKAKRVLALLLTLALCVSLLNLATFAASESSYCGIKEHTHTDECYETLITDTLICGKEATKGHTHDEDCYEMQTVEDAQEVLDCDLKESEGHTHVESCYSKPELTCELEETEGHTHSEDCYDEDGNLTCDLVESEGHSHGEGCYGDPELTCGLEESEGHTHTADCYTTEIVEVKETVLTCEQEESEAHEHTDACYATEKVLVCTTSEHTHDASCSWVRDADQLEKAIAAGGPVTLGANISVSSTITISKNVTLDLNGCTITYTGSTGSVFHVTSGTFTLNATSGGMITGGKGTNVKWAEIVDRHTDNGEPAGGAVLVEASATFTMNGGTISGNSATWGGGIAVAREGNLNIYGGTISNNTATSSDKDTLSSAADGSYGGGGGIFCAGTGLIRPTQGSILITGNKTGTINDLGGGGIFIESKGTMKIYNAVITDNTAAGQGGGVAGCLHGKVTNLSPDTAALYGNTAYGQSVVTRQSAIDHYTWWQNKSGFTSNASDYFCAGYSVVGSISMNGGDAMWTGWKATSATSGVSSVSSAESDPIVVQGVLGLSAGSDNTVGIQADAFRAENNVVEISGNTSAMHGGGIGCNGTLSFGEASYSYSNSTISLIAAKEVEGNDVTKADYTFELYLGNTLLATAESDNNGKIRFDNLPTSVLFGSKTQSGTVSATLTLKEVSGSKTGMTYDTKERTITLTATRNSEKKVISTGTGGLDVTSYEFTDTLTGATNATISGSTVTLIDEANFLNKMSYGELSISKQLEQGDEADEDTLWNFTVKFTGNDLPQSYTYTVDGEKQPLTNGGTISLTAGQTATITGIPAGARYTVTEASGNYYTTESTGATGTIDADEPSEAEFTNTIIRGSISISKELVLDDVPKNLEEKEYTFAVYDSEDNLVGEVTVTAGGGAAVIENLRYGGYTIVEVDPTKIDDYDWSSVTLAVNGKALETSEIVVDGETLTGYAVEVKSNGQEIAVKATNSYERHTGDLSITKTVEGDLGDKNREWHFTVTLESPEEYVHLAPSYEVTAPADVEVTVFDEDGTETTATERQDVTSSLTFTEQEDGKFVSAPITLKHGETATIEGIPVGTAYKVTEAEADQGGYQTTSTDAEDKIVQGVKKAWFTNANWSSPTPTTSLTIEKVWDDEGNEDARPDSIQVRIYRNGSAYKDVTLSAANNWRFTQNGLSAGSIWTVEEIDVPEGYTSSVSVSQNGTRVTITNTYEEVEEEPEEPEDPEDPEEPENPEEPEEFEEFEIEDPEVPLANMPEKPEELEEFEIEDPDVPLANVPKTGDTIGFWEMLAALSAMGLALLLGKRKKEEEA